MMILLYFNPPTTPGIIIAVIRDKNIDIKAVHQLSRQESDFSNATTFTGKDTVHKTSELELLKAKVNELEDRLKLSLEKQKELIENKNRYERITSTIPCALYDYIRKPDGENRFFYISPRCKEIFGFTQEQIMADSSILWAMVHPDDLDRLNKEDCHALQTLKLFQSEFRIILSSGEIRWLKMTSMPGNQELDGLCLWSGIILDITEKKLAEEEREHLINELKSALENVKTLSGLLPICASCKKIRNDKGYWTQIEAYIHEHSDAEFSHGICPDCAKELYRDLYKERNRKR